MSDSDIDDYEWKLIPDAQGRLPDAPAGDFEGVYYVLWFDKPKGRFVFQHDTRHCGTMGAHWEEATYTEIRPAPLTTRVTPKEPGSLRGHPPVGWLCDHLEQLITRFAPNHFSVT